MKKVVFNNYHSSDVQQSVIYRDQADPAAKKGGKALCEHQKESGRLINSRLEKGCAKPFDPDTATELSRGAFISIGSGIWKMVQC